MLDVLLSWIDRFKANGEKRKGSTFPRFGHAP